MKVKNFIKRGLAGLLSLLILLGDVGSPGILSAWAEETATEIVETYIPPEAADTAQAAAIAADEALASAAEADVSEEDPAAGTDASGGPTTTTTNEINTSSEEGTQQQTEGSAGSGESVSADSAGSGTGLEGAATGESVSADPESVTDTETDAGEIQDAPEGNTAQQSVTGQSQPADEAAEEEKEPAALSVSALTADARYATANVSAMNYSVSIAGGTAPYQVHFTVQNSGALCFEHRVELAAPGNAEFSYIPAASGSHDIAVTVVDAQYTTLNQWASMPVSSGETDDYDTAVSHVALSGDWANDVMNIAVSQIGVGEKQHNFIIDENNTYHYYSMYADWYGEPYADWSAIFAAYCLNKAGVPEGAIPVDKDAEKMLAAVTGKGLYKAAAEYVPVIGDLVFLSENRVGIVSVAGNGEVYIIAGDSDDQVRQLVMQMTDPAILGYVSLSEAKAAYEAGGADEQQPQQGAEPEAEPETEENTADAAVIPENVDISVYPAASAVGDTVTFSADIPADIDPDSLIYSWQLSPDGAEWVEMASTDVPSYTVQTSARHYLNYIRVAVSADPGYVKPEPAQTESVEPEAGEAVPEEPGSENENQSEPAQDTQTIAPAQTQPIAAQAARNIRRISYSADNSSAQTSSDGIMLTAIEYENAIFWNPYGSNTYSEDGVVIVAAGSDSNAGTQIKPVLSLAKAIELAHADGANKTIVCMNLYNSYGDVSMESTESAVSLLGYDGGGEGEAAAHEGLFISSKSGVLVVQNLHTDSNATGAVIEANGGEIYLQSGNNIPGNIYINKLSTNYLPITASGANAANSGKYIIDFDPDYVGTVGIAKGGLEANSQYLQLSQTLIDRGWSFKELNGNTYAHIPPHYEAVFIDGLNGSDANLGNSEEFPVRTFAQAKALMEANGISTLYVMGTVALTAGNAGEHLLLPEGAKAVRHVSCTGAMFEISGGEHTVSFIVNGGLESGTDAAGSPSYTAYDAAIFNVTGGKLTVSASANISGAAGCAITMSGGSLDLSACKNNITANGIVKGSAADIVLGGSSLDGGSMPVADVTVSGSFTADGATLSSTAANTLIVSGTAVIKNCTVAKGSGSIKSGSGSLTVESTDLAAIEAAGVLNVKNSNVTTINNTGSATTIDAVSVSTLNSAGAVKVLNGSAVSNSLSASGSSLEISGSTVGSESAAATVTAGGDVSITASQVYASISAQGAVGISSNSAVTGTVDADGNVTVDASTVSGKISGSAVEIKNTSTVADIEAGSTVTATSSTAGAIDARGDANITSSQLNGALSTGGKLSMSDSNTKSTVTASGAAEISGSTIESTLTVSGMTSLRGGTVTTANLGDSTITGTAITTLTATGDTELVSGSVSALISEGNVTAMDGTVTKLELRGDSAYLLTGGDYTASVPDIALSGSGAYIKLQGAAADSSSIILTIAREYDGRLVVEGVDGYDASTQLSKYQRAEGSTDIYKLLGEGNNIVIEGPNGVYVSTQYPGTLGTDGYGTQVDNPAQSFEEAVAILNEHPEFARIINVIGTVTITSSDRLNISGETVTVVPYSDEKHPAVSTLISIDSGASFSASNANFDGAGLADASTLFDVAGSLTLSGSPSLSNADTVIKNSGTSSLGSSVISAEAGGTGISLSAGSVSGSNVKISVDGAGTGLDISGGSLDLSGSSTAIDIGGNGTGVKMSGGTVSALGGSININGVGKGIDMSSGTATVSAGINVKNSGSLGVDIDGGTLTYSGTIYGTNAMDIAEATVNFNGGGTRNASGYSNMKSEGLVTLSGGTLNISGATISSLQQKSGSTSIKSGTVYYMGMESGKLNSSGGSISNLSMNGGTTSVTEGSNNISTMTQNGGTTAISGGRVYSLTLNKGSVTVSGGSLDYSTVNGGLADSTLDIKGGAANSISQYGGIVTVSGGSVSYARLYRGTSSALLYANGGSITETSLLGAGSVLHTNGKCRLGDVKIGSGGSGRDSYIELSGPMTANSASNPVEISDIANANYHENYSVVIPKSGSGVDASDYLSCFEYDDRVEERFILAGGADEKATHIVLSFEGVFIDTENGDDTNDGLSHANPVKTFARAGEVLKGRIDSDPGALRVIYVVDKNNPNGPATATVRGADTLDMSSYSDSYVMPFHTSCDTLVKVPAGASFTVTSARIDGVGNNAAASTATVMDVAGSLTLNSAQLINARGTVLKLSGSAVLNNSSIYPYSSSRSSATSVKLNGGALDLNSSTVSYGRYGVDMSGGTLDIDSGSAIRYAYTGLKLSSGDVTLAGAVSGSSYTGIEMSGGTVTQSGSVNSNGSYYTGSSKGGVYMSGGEYKMTSGSINSNSGYSSGGGVTVAGGSFTASGGSISSNKTNASGGGIMISSGSAVLSNTNISYNYAAYYSATNGMGGGVCASGGTLSLTNCTVSSNRGGSGSSVSLLGGGIYAGAGASLTVSGTAVSDNSASSGGGLYMGGGTVSITGGSINSNTASSMGGGVYAGASGSMTISGAGINSNTAAGGNGGGVYWVCGNGGSISGGSLDGNKAPNGNGGGLYISGSSSSHSHGFSFTSIKNNSAANGGGVYNNCDTAVDLSAASAMSGNSASTAGGALYMAKGSVTLPSAMSSNTVSGNEGKGGAVYVGSGTLSGSSVNFSGSKAVNGLGGVIYVNSGTVSLPGSTLSTSNASASAKQGGAVYVVNGTVDLSGSSISGSKATEGSGGAVYLQSGSIDLTNATISGAASAAAEGVDASGGAVYIKDGTAVMEGAKLSGSAETNGGAVCIMGGTADMDGAAITNSSAALGGGLYVGGGSVSMLKNGNTASSISGCSVSGEDAEGAAIYLEGGELSFYGSASSTGDANTVFVGEKSSFKHKGGTITGDVRTEGDYVITLPDAWVKGELTIASNEHPLVIDPASTENGSNKFEINAHKDIFAEVIIVDGTMTVPAKLSQFTIDSSKNNNITNPSEVGDDIFGGASVDVYWDPTGTNGDDAHSGGSYVEAVRTFNKAMQLLATKGPASRIILCSTATALTSYDGNSYTDASGKAAALDWNAKVVRYYDPSGTNTFKGTMFSNVTSMSDIIISGEAHMSDGGVVLIDGYCNIVSSSSALKLTNVEFCYHNMDNYDGLLGGSDVTLENCDIHNCEYNLPGSDSGIFCFLGAGKDNITLINTDIHQCKNTGNTMTSFLASWIKISISGGTISNNESITSIIDAFHAAAVDIDDARFENNTVNENIIYCQHMYMSDPSDVDIDNTVFISNSSTGSAVILASRTDLHVDGCTFENNNFTGDGGAINVAINYGSDTTASITNNSFNGNATTGDGGAVYIGSSVSVTNFSGNSFTNNTASGNGGAVYLSAAAEISGSTFIGNRANGGNGGAVCVPLSGPGMYAARATVGGGGDLTVTDSVFTGNESNGFVGAVFFGSEGATLSVSGSSFENNVSKEKSFDMSPGLGRGGGAICIEADMPSKIIIGSGCKFIGNSAAACGGALEIGRHNLTIAEDTEFINNTAGAYGGALFMAKVSSGDTTSLSGLKFTGNSAGSEGGAVYFSMYDVEIANSSFINNSVTGDSGVGGAIRVNGDTTIKDSTFTGNTATSNGGALYIKHETSNAKVTVTGSAFNNNSASSGGAIYSEMPMNNESEVTGSLTVSSSSFDGNSADSGAVYYVNDAIGVGSLFTVSFSDSAFTRNISDDAVIFIRAKSTVIDGCTFGNESAMAYPADKEAALSSGGNAANYIVYALYGLNISGSTFSGNYCSDSAVWSNAAGDGLTISDSHIDCNKAEYGLNAGGASQYISSLAISDSSFDGNSGIGAYLGGFADSTTTTATITNSSFSHNGGNGLYANCGNLYQSASDDTAGRRLEISGSVISFNGDSGLKLAGVSGHNGMTGLKNVTVEGNGSLSGTGYGGGIYVGEYVTIYLDSSVAIKNNKAENGGAIYWESDSDFTQDGEGAVLSGNEAVNGGAFYAEQPVTLGGFIVKNNKAVKGGGMYVDMPAILKTSGEKTTVILQNDEQGHPTQFIGNTAEHGGAIYIAPVANDASAKNYYVNLSQVSISGNSSTSDGGYSSGIYNEGSRLYMAGDNAAVEDNIFLNKSGRHIHLSSSLSDVVYNIAVNMDTDGGYGYGDVVVSPTANGTTNAAQYLRSTNAVVPGSVFAKGSCGTEHSEHTSVTATVDAIVLKSCIFVDGVKGSDSNDGSTPSKAFKTMEKAIEAAGSGNAVIYVCGTVTVTGSASWNNANNVAVEIRRYTGFNIGGGDNSDDYGQAFICKEDMISVAEGASLTLGKTVEVVAGSHNASDTISATGSIFNVSGTLVLPNAVSIEANYSSANGSAIKVNEGGAVTVQGAVTISDCSGSNGGGIYNEGSVNITSGSLTVSGCEASVNGASVYNNGVFKVDAAAAFNADGEFYIARDKFLTVGSSSAKINDGMSALFIDIEAPVDQRVYVSYETAFSDESAEEAKYALSPSITASFLRESGAGNTSLILSQSNIVYVGDTVINDKLTEGLSADYPFTSLKDAYKYLADKGGGLIYIVDTIDVTAGMTVGSGRYADSSETITLSDGGVSIRRYSKPTSFTNTTSQSFTAKSNTGALFDVTSGSLTLDGVVLDGHNYAITSAGEKTQFTIAPAVSADAALVAVSGTGSLILTNGASLVSNTSSNKGDAISHSGAEVRLSGESVNVEGSVYLAEDEVVTVTDPSLSPAAKLILELDDAYDGRVIAQYTHGDDTAPDGGETSKYVLPESVAEYYKLAVDAEDDTVILRTNRAVYVDGVAGDDTNAGTPDSPIRTLRRAYELLSGYGGSIYIVDTVSIEGGADISLSSTQYYDGNTVTIQSGSVEIVRYSKPSAAPKGYSRESFVSGNGENASLIAVKSGSSLTLSNITLDGHNAARSGSSTTAAPAVAAKGPAVYVRGSLVLDGAELKNNTNSYSKGGAVLVAASGSVLMRGGAALSGNVDADGANGVFLTGKLDIGGSVSFAKDQWVYENNSHIDVSASFSGIIPVELAEQDVDSGKVIASYAAGLKPNAASFAITGANQQKAQALNISKTVAGQDVILKASYAVSYKLTNGLENAADAPSMAADYEEFNTGIKAESGYVLPKSITITVTPLEYVRNEKGEFEAKDGDPVTLNSGLDYSYDPADGSIKVFNDKVTGKLEISAEGIKVHLISYSYEIPGSVQPAGDNPTSVLNAEGFSASFYPAAGYENLSVKSITVGGITLAAKNYTAVYDVQNEELSLSVGSGHVTGNVTVTVSAQLKQYNIGEQIDGVTMELPGKIAHGAALEATELVLENQDAYEMPESVTVYVGSRELNADEYTYEDGKLSIIEGVVDGDVRITGTAKIKEFKVEYALMPAGTLVQADNAPAKVNYGAELATGIMLTDTVKYALPKAVTVTMGGNEFTDFAYDAANGTIAIAEGKITGDIVISAEARDVYTVEYVYDENHVTAGSANPGTVIELEALSAGFTPKPGYQIDSITVTLNEAELTEGVSRSGDSISIAGGVINAGPVKITVESSLKQYAITEGVGNASVNDVTDREPVTVPDGTAGQPEHKVGHGEELKLKILPDDENGYTYPDSVTVTINGQQETVTAIEDGKSAEGITYNKSSGVVTIPDGFVDGPVSITGDAKLKTYTVETALDNLTVTGTTNITTADGKYTVSHGSPDGDVVITIDDTVTGYDLPETVTVTIGGTEYENVGAEGGIIGISYNKSTGAITIPNKMVTGNITVQAGGVLEQYEVVYKFSSNNGTAKKGSTDVTSGDTVNYHEAYSSVISANTGYRITEVKVTTAGTTGALYDNQNLEQTAATGIITGTKTDNGDYTSVALNIGTGVVTGELTVTVTLAKRQYTVTNNVEHSDIDDDETPDEVTVTDGDEGGEDVVITIEPEDGYDPPAEDDLVIIVKDPDDEGDEGEPLPKDSYTYDPETGEIVITKPEDITGPIEISGDIRKEVYDVSFDFVPDAAAGTAKVGNKDVTAGDKVEYNTAYSAVISVAKGYKIDSIEVSRVDEERNTFAALTKGTDFAYSGTKTDNGDYTSYTLSVKASGHTGDILVVINASRRTYTITEDVDDATVTKDNETVSETPTDPDATVTGPKVTDGEDITVTVVPGEDHSYPDEITVTIKDPDDPGEDKTVTVEKGGKDEKTGIEYKDDGTVTIPGDVITGPVEISGEALEKFDVNVTIEPVKDANDNADYQRTDDIKDVTVTGETGENVAVETHSHELTITPETGYTIVSITVANGSETGNIPVKESGTADSGYSYDKTTGKLTVSEVKGDITVTVNTERTRYDVEYQLKKDSEDTAKLEVSDGYTEEGGNVPIHGEDFTTYIEGIDNTITLPDSIKVYVDGEELPAQDDEGNSNYTYISSGTDAGKIVIPGDKVTGKVVISAVGIESFTAEYSITLTASETFVSGVSDVKLDLVAEDSKKAVSLARLQGKSFKVTSVTMPKGITLADKEAVADVKTTAGSGYANANFAITAGSTDLYDVQNAGAWFSFTATSSSPELTFTIHNANAITTADDAGTVVVKLESDIGDEITLNITIKRSPSQLNVTVPLVLVMKTNIDGGSVENLGSYAISNKSSMDVKLTKAEVADTSDIMAKSDTDSFTGVDQFYVGVQTGQTIRAQTGTFNPITKLATSPLSFVTADDDSMGLHMATVTYTVAIPE